MISIIAHLSTRYKTLGAALPVQCFRCSASGEGLAADRSLDRAKDMPHTTAKISGVGDQYQGRLT